MTNGVFAELCVSHISFLAVRESSVAFFAIESLRGLFGALVILFGASCRDGFSGIRDRDIATVSDFTGI